MNYIKFKHVLMCFGLCFLYFLSAAFNYIFYTLYAGGLHCVEAVLIWVREPTF
jgi:hypothetical protein